MNTPLSHATPFRDRWAMTPEATALTILTACLVVFGLATLYSASAIVAIGRDLPSTTFFFQQLTGVAVGAGAFMFAAKFDAAKLDKLAWPIMLVALVLMAVTVTPGIATVATIGGSRRFLFGGSVQPAELAKIAVVIWTAMLVLRKGDTMRRLTRGLPPFLLIVGILAGIAFLQPDLSMALMFLLLMGIILFAAGVRIGHFVVLGILVAPVIWHELQDKHYALARIWSFVGLEKVPSQIGYQQQQSLIAVGSGGLTGTGFGEGLQQYGWVPMGIDDFIASNIGEEWGFLGLSLVVLMFAVYTWLGFRIARQARSPFLQLVALGLTATVAITAYVHIAVVVSLLPNTGLTLPFFSNGRSNLVLTLLTTGVLVNIGSVRERVYHSGATDPLGIPA
ncbi:MAG: FtsW/RodA/SpoVE family cell cycle protein [Gemmatimonadota bacterium]